MFVDSAYIIKYILKFTEVFGNNFNLINFGVIVNITRLNAIGNIQYNMHYLDFQYCHFDKLGSRRCYIKIVN